MEISEEAYQFMDIDYKVNEFHKISKLVPNIALNYFSLIIFMYILIDSTDLRV